MESGRTPDSYKKIPRRWADRPCGPNRIAMTDRLLAEMIGTTRSRVSFFMNRFRKLGFIEYNGRIKVHKSLLNAVLLDRLSEVNPDRPPASATARTRSKPARSA